MPARPPRSRKSRRRRSICDSQSQIVGLIYDSTIDHSVQQNFYPNIKEIEPWLNCKIKAQ
jgi:hypothetical protein